MAVYSHRTGEDLSTGGKFLREAGSFHFVIDAVECPPLRDGKLIPGGAFRLDTKVLAGTAPGCENKTKDLMFFEPKPDKTLDRKQIDRLFLACNLTNPEDTNKDLAVDLDELVGKQFLATLELKDDGYLRFHFADIFHVDDPEAAWIPKNLEALKLLPAKYRRIGDKPAPKPAPVKSLSADDLAAI